MAKNMFSNIKKEDQPYFPDLEDGEEVQEQSIEDVPLLSHELMEDEVQQYVQQEEVMSQALIRLEQGKLYHMLINHDLFAQVEAPPSVIETVQTEIREFIVSRLEVLLGMRSEAAPKVKYESPFTDSEVSALKMLAQKMTGGLEKKLEPKSNTLTPVSKPAPVKPQIAPMAPKKAVQAVQPIQPLKQVNAIQKTVQKPAQKTRAPKAKRSEIDKPIWELTPEELAKRNSEIEVKRGVPTNALPMPSVDQQEMIFTQRLMENTKNSQLHGLYMKATGGNQ